MKGGADCPPIAEQIAECGIIYIASMKGGRTAPR